MNTCRNEVQFMLRGIICRSELIGKHATIMRYCLGNLVCTRGLNQAVQPWALHR